MKTILYIDTSDNTKTIVRLKLGSKILEEMSGREETRAQVTLRLIEKVLKDAKMELKDLDSIKVKRGPGSYTGLKVGVSIANALSFALEIPVNYKKLGELEEPLYE